MFEKIRCPFGWLQFLSFALAFVFPSLGFSENKVQCTLAAYDFDGAAYISFNFEADLDQPFSQNFEIDRNALRAKLSIVSNNNVAFAKVALYSVRKKHWYSSKTVETFLEECEQALKQGHPAPYSTTFYIKNATIDIDCTPRE